MALKGDAKAEKAKNQLWRDFLRLSIFDFCNNIGHEQTFSGPLEASASRLNRRARSYWAGRMARSSARPKLFPGPDARHPPSLRTYQRQTRYLGDRFRKRSFLDAQRSTRRRMLCGSMISLERGFRVKSRALAGLTFWDKGDFNVRAILEKLIYRLVATLVAAPHSVGGKIHATRHWRVVGLNDPNVFERSKTNISPEGFPALYRTIWGRSRITCSTIFVNSTKLPSASACARRNRLSKLISSMRSWTSCKFAGGFA